MKTFSKLIVSGLSEIQAIKRNWSEYWSVYLILGVFITTFFLCVASVVQYVNQLSI